MVTRADKLFEKFSLSRNGVIALPITVSESSDGSISYSVYKKLMRKVSAFEKTYKDPFCEDNADKLRAICEPLMKKHGYSISGDPEILTELEARVSPPRGKADTIILKTCDEIAKYPADTTLWNLDVDDEDTADVICAVIENGHVAAYACVNDTRDADGYEITVECAPQYRGRGFASSCAAALTGYLISEAKASVVYYKCRSSNSASRRVAEKAGFTYTGRSMTFVYER